MPKYKKDALEHRFDNYKITKLIESNSIEYGKFLIKNSLTAYTKFMSTLAIGLVNYLGFYFMGLYILYSKLSSMREDFKKLKPINSLNKCEFNKRLLYRINFIYNFNNCRKLEFFFLNNHLLIKKTQQLPLNLRSIKKRIKKKSKKKLKNLGLLYVTFSKRNTFFNLTDSYSKTLNLITVRREGFLGRRRTEYTSIFSTSRSIKQKFKPFKLDSIALIYKGWSRFRAAIKKSLRFKDTNKLPLIYIKYVVKIPHNGCRPRKVKRKKRKRKIWLKKKHHYKFFQSKFYSIKINKKKSRLKLLKKIKKKNKKKKQKKKTNHDHKLTNKKRNK